MEAEGGVRRRDGEMKRWRDEEMERWRDGGTVEGWSEGKRVARERETEQSKC